LRWQRGGLPMRPILIAFAVLGFVVFADSDTFAQGRDSYPIGPGGQCPSNYTIQNGLCRPYRGGNLDREDSRDSRGGDRRDRDYRDYREYRGDRRDRNYRDYREYR